MLSLRSVTQRYGSLTALDGVSLEVSPGEFFGLQGPKGAGKSTLMSLAAGLRSSLHALVQSDDYGIHSESYGEDDPLVEATS